MSDSKLQAYADLRVKTGSYEIDGKTKNRYVTVGTLLSTPHHNNMVIKLDAMPTSRDWDGTIYISRRESWNPDSESKGDGIEL
jgi:hypothetical protein